MSRASRRRLGAILAAAALSLAGCETAPQRPLPAGAPIRPEEAEELVRRWDAEWQAFPGLRAAVDLTVRRQGRTDRAAAVLLLSKTHLRLEVMAPFGIPALVVTASPERVLVFRPLERLATTARASPEAVARWLGAPIPPEVLIGLLVGRIPTPPDAATVRVEERPSPHLVLERPSIRHRVWVTPDRQPVRLDVEGGERLTATFERLVDGRVGTVHLDVPGRDAGVTLRYLSAEYVTPPPDAFEVILPVDVKLERVD